MYGLFGVSAGGRCFPQCRWLPHLYNVSTGPHGVGGCNGVLMAVLTGLNGHLLVRSQLLELASNRQRYRDTKVRLTDEDTADMTLWLL